jgi:hypothetical protein
LKNTADRGSGPTLDGAEIFIHMTETLFRGTANSQSFAACHPNFNLQAYLKLEILAPQIRAKSAGQAGTEVRYNQ